MIDVTDTSSVQFDINKKFLYTGMSSFWNIDIPKNYIKYKKEGRIFIVWNIEIEIRMEIVQNNDPSRVMTAYELEDRE